MENIINQIVNDFSNPTPTFIIAQVLGFCALICTVTSMQLKQKRWLMILQTLSELFIVLQYFCLGAWAGGFISCVSLVRDFVLTAFYEKKRAPLWLLIAIYIALIGTTSYSAFAMGEGAMALIPFFGSLIYATSLWYGKTKWIRFGNAAGNTPYIFYTLIKSSYVVMIMTVIEVASSIIGFIRIDILGKGKKKKTSPKKPPVKSKRK